jgi:hypothetical protein
MDSYNAYRDRDREQPQRSPRDREWSREDRKDDRSDSFYRARSPGALLLKFSLPFSILLFIVALGQCATQVLAVHIVG